MTDIDSAIDREMGSVLKRSYALMIFLYTLVDYPHAPQIMLIMFAAPPADAFQYNPNADNSTRTMVSEWQFTDVEVNWIPGFLQSIFFVGFMIGTVLFGQLSDKYGRRSVGWKVYTLLLVASFASAFTQNWKQLVACRIGSGLGIGGLSVINTIMLQEMSAARIWVINGAYGGVTFTCTMLIFLLFGYYFPDWRTLAKVSMLPAFLGYIFYIVLPESPRWLFSQGRVEEAQKVMQFFAKVNGTKGSGYQMLENAPKKATTPVKESIQKIKNSILDLVKYPVLRYRTAILSYQWFTTSFVFYCITLGAGSFSPNFYLAFGMSAISQLPSVPICLYFMSRKWCGRTRCLAGLMSLSAISLFIMYVLPDTEANGHWRLLLSMSAKVGASGCFTLIYVFTPELYPTVVRNVGLGSMSTVARIGSMTAPFLATWTVNSGSETPFLCYGVLCGLAAVLALLLPETCGKKITNTIEESYQQEEEEET